MTNQPFASDDDDLFAYDPSLNSTQNNISSSNKIISDSSDMIQNISKQIEKSKDDDILGSFSTRIRFAQALLVAYTEFISFGAIFFHKAVHQTLDRLTSGNFSMLYMFNYLEYNILRRTNIKFLLQNTFLDNEQEAVIQFKKFVDKTGFSLDDSFISLYIKTNIEINDHVTNIERSMYIALSEKLQITPNPVIINPNPTVQELSDSTPSSLAEYHDELFRSMFSSLADSAYLQNLSDLSSVQVRLSQI